MITDNGAATAESAPARNVRLTGQAVGGWFVARYVLALIGLWTSLITPASVTLAIRVGQLDPAGKAGSLAFVASLGAAAALLANPIFGALSDRSTSRFGQRRSYIIGGIAVGSLATLGIGIAPTIPLVAIGWALAQTAFNAAVASLIAILPERVPAASRGRVAGFMGMTSQVGAVGGTYLIQLVGTRGVWMFLAPVLIGVLLVLPFALTLREVPRTREETAPINWRLLLGAMWINPRENRDFALAWAGRFLVWISLYLLTTYKTYFLIDRLGYSADDVAPVLSLAMLLLASCLGVSSIIGGWMSDRLGRRKVFVIAASVLFVAGMLVVAFAGNVEHFLVGISIAGFAQGLYMGVDYALVADVLPDGKTEAAKGMGVFNLSSTIPQTVAPILAPVLLTVGASGGTGNYTALYVSAAVFALAGAVAVQLIRGVK